MYTFRGIVSAAFLGLGVFSDREKKPTIIDKAYRAGEKQCREKKSNFQLD